MDKTDMAILARLLHDCRESDRQLGRAVGVSGAAARARISKMERAGIITGYEVLVEPPALGYGVFYVVVSGDLPESRLRRLRLIGEPFYTVPCVGGITVRGVAVEGDAGAKTALAAEALGEDVRVLTVLEAGGPTSGSGLRRADLDVIGALLDDPRRPVGEAARAAGLSARTVSRSLERLQADEAVQFTATYEPSLLSGYVPYVVLARVRRDVARARRGMDRRFAGSYMRPPISTRDQVVLFMYSESIFGMDEAAGRARKVPGVESTDIFVPKRIGFPREWVRGAVRRARSPPARGA